MKVARGLIIAIIISGLLPLMAPAGASTKKNTVEPASKNFKLGKQLYDKHDYDGAIDALLQSVYFARNSYAPESFYYLGLAYQAKQDHKRAIEAFKKNIDQAMDGAGWGHLHLAEEYVKTKQYDEAYPHIAKALTAGGYNTPLSRRGFYVYALMEDQKGNANDALSRYTSAMGEEPWRDFDPWIGMIECYMKTKEWGDAYKNLNNILESRVYINGLSYERVYLDMGICLLAKGNHQGAMDAWRKCLGHNPNNKEAHLQLGMMLDSENHISAAIDEYKSFIRCNQDPNREDTAADERSRQVENRIAMLEQKLSEPAPDNGVRNQSPYIRQQQEKARMAEEQERQRQAAEMRRRALEEQQKSLPKDAGF